MTIRDMRIFVTVCKNGNNLSKAARELYMTQPSVSLAIQEMEQEYGIPLFDRISRRLYLTEAGREYQNYAQRILSLYDEMDDRFRNWNKKGRLFVGASMTIGSEWMSRYVSEFENRFPDIDVRVTIEHSIDLEENLFTNDLDLALVETPVTDRMFRTEKFMEDTLEVVAPPDSGYAQGTVISVEEFARAKLLLREKGSGTREIFDLEMEKCGCSPVPVWEASSTSALVNAVRYGMGISVLPRRIVEPEIHAGNMIRIRVEGMEFKQSFFIVTHKDKVITQAMSKFIAIVKSDID